MTVALGDPCVPDEDLDGAAQGVGTSVEVVAADDDRAWIAERDGHKSSSEVGRGLATPGRETGTFKLKCTPAMRMKKQIAAATTAMAPP